MEHYTLPVGVTSPVTLAHLSDFHFSDVVPNRLIDAAIEKAVAANPDAIVLTGDYITSNPDLSLFEATFAKLQQAIPVYASFGNHDGGTWQDRQAGLTMQYTLRRHLKNLGVIVLENEVATQRIGNQHIRFVGLGDFWANRFEPNDVLKKGVIDDDATIIVLSHNPDTKEQLFDYHWHAMFAGHTHGGEANIFGWRPVLSLPVKDTSFPCGSRQFGNKWVHITRGVGSLYGMRLGCPPEVSIVTLV